MTTHSRRSALAMATGVLLGGPMVAGCTLEHEKRAVDTSSVQEAPAADGATRSALTRSYEWSNTPSPLVLVLPRGDVTLNAWTTCWNGPAGADGVSSSMCSDGVTPELDGLETVGPVATVDFWFGRPGWTFEASFMRDVPGDDPGELVGKGAVSRTAAQDFTITVAGGLPSGTYRVDLFGSGPEGDYVTSFAWVA